MRNRRRLAVAASVFSHWMPSFRTHLRIGAGLFSSFIGGIRLTLTGLRTRMEWGHSKWTHLRSDWYCTQPGRVPGHARHSVGPRAAQENNIKAVFWRKTSRLGFGAVTACNLAGWGRFKFDLDCFSEWVEQSRSGMAPDGPSAPETAGSAAGEAVRTPPAAPGV